MANAGEFVKIFDSRQEASAELGIPPSGFVKKSAGGFLWEYYTDNFPSSIEPYFSDDASKPVIQLSPDRNFYLNTFDSAVIASKSLGISYGHISSVCNGSRATSSGYSWVFEDEFDYNLPKGRESNDFYQKLAREIALEKSSSKISPVTKVTRSETPACWALRLAKAAKSGLNSIPIARAP